MLLILWFGKGGASAVFRPLPLSDWINAGALNDKNQMYFRHGRHRHPWRLLIVIALSSGATHVEGGIGAKSILRHQSVEE